MITDEMVNKGIAKFEFSEFEITDDGIEVLHDGIVHVYSLYTDSLDKLVSVWEKLDLRMGHFASNYYDKSSFDFIVRPEKLHHGVLERKPSIQQAAAHATYKAIMELGK